MNPSLVRIVMLMLLIASTFAQFHRSGNCPLRNTVTNCTPRCMNDEQCPFNQKCCPNKCSSTSCAQSSAINTGSDGGYKDQAVYCNGVKCAAYEKCQYDRSARREKCTRA
ncbi:waprin-Thr1 isoform X2 [Camponotus floridanus]|uniref:waprin-Thr1 isoform X2 n=1 Tax=Camponotus floridanus TaxID=104421 RepID=UPI00059E1B2B|nr:waprin-Thr1 isoform X2 [Camponotus floridanus]